MNKKEETKLAINYYSLSAMTEEIYQLASLLTKYCEAKKDSDDLYEVSLVTKIIQEKANNLAHEMYRLTNDDIKPFSIEQFKDKIVEFVE